MARRPPKLTDDYASCLADAVAEERRTLASLFDALARVEAEEHRALAPLFEAMAREDAETFRLLDTIVREEAHALWLLTEATEDELSPLPPEELPPLPPERWKK